MRTPSIYVSIANDLFNAKFWKCVEQYRDIFKTNKKCIFLFWFLPKLLSFHAWMNHCLKKQIWYIIVPFSKFSRDVKVTIVVPDGWNIEKKFYCILEQTVAFSIPLPKTWLQKLFARATCIITYTKVLDIGGGYKLVL